MGCLLCGFVSVWVMCWVKVMLFVCCGFMRCVRFSRCLLMVVMFIRKCSMCLFICSGCWIGVCWFFSVISC